MKKKIAALVLFSALLFYGCKKIIQQQEQNALVSIITNGKWYVQKYVQDTTDITSSFSAYTFQFKSDGTVTGTNGTVSITGTWSGDLTSKTITSQFPAGSGILNDLDGTWKITDSSLTYVVANTTINSITNNLRLQKQ
ncbi:MAG: hypothetical protein JST87_14440 [Bacteroidetes bacterium]|nr:hypothetical protein [Bacteroidota bacterium]